MAKSKNNAKGEINLRNIVGVREASKGKIPGNSRGIELVSSSGKITPKSQCVYGLVECIT